MMKHYIVLVLSLLLLAGCASKPQSAPAASAAVDATFPTQPALVQPVSPKDCGIGDGVYQMAVTLSGGTGKANVLSPAVVEVENGQAFANIQWSSSNYDYMIVDGQRYDALSMEGGSVFRIPISGFNGHVEVTADTIAMSTPHEIDYTLFFDASSAEAVEDPA